MSFQRKRLGYCPITGTQLFEFRSQFPSEHPLAGEPIALGAPFPHALRVALLLTSGQTTNVSMSSDGLDMLLSGKYLWQDLHKSLIAGLLYEQQTKVIRSGKVTPQQEARQLRQVVVKLNNSPPIGVLHADPWVELTGERLNG